MQNVENDECRMHRRIRHFRHCAFGIFVIAHSAFSSLRIRHFRHSAFGIQH